MDALVSLVRSDKAAMQCLVKGTFLQLDGFLGQQRQRPGGASWSLTQSIVSGAIAG